MFVTLAAEQYAVRENSAGRRMSAVMSSWETAVGFTLLSSPEPKLMPKSGAGAARASVTSTAMKGKTRRVIFLRR